MVDKELLEAIAQMMATQKKEISELMDAKLKPIQKDMAQMKEDVAMISERLDRVEESQEEIRSGVNSLLEWAEECGNVIKFPLPKVK